MDRRISKKVWNNTAGTGTPATYLKFVCDGWNLIAGLDGNNANAIKRSFIWGLDLSGSEQGAGGVGGLLAIKPASSNPSFIAYDGNGNVAALIDATAGTTSGNFEYGPFGETIRLTPNANNQSPFKFSTKYQDDESDFLYYGYRYYNPSTGRWLNRDPIEEAGGKNIYEFVRNSPVDQYDLLGRCGPGGRGPQCGDDVTKPLNYTLGRIRYYYKELMRPEMKRKVCLEIVGKGPRGVEGAKSAWSLVEFLVIGYGIAVETPAEVKKGTLAVGFFFGDSSCPRTVTFAGKCYYATAANMAMWGVIMRLCNDDQPEKHWTLDNALGLVQLWKLTDPDGPKLPGDAYLDQSLAFTRFGYTADEQPNWNESQSQRNWNKACKGSSVRAKKDLFDWWWVPYSYPDKKLPKI